MPTIGHEKLEWIGTEIFKRLGSSEEEARTVSRLLVKANLVGHDSHGVIRIPQYVRSIEKGEIVPNAEVEIVRESASTALLNGNWGFGQIVGMKAMSIAIEKARRNAAGIVCVHNSNHIGRLADYTLKAVENGMIGIAAVNSIRNVAPYGGIDRMLSTAPISFAFPVEGEVPFVLDISTSVCAEGKVRFKFHKGEKLPDGCIIDKNGRPSNDPADFYEGGAILPLGGRFGYKGFGLSLAVEALTAVLAQSEFSFEDEKKGNGIFMEAINIEEFMPLNRFKERMSYMIKKIKSSRLMPGFKEILIPGEIEFRTERKRLREGIYVPDRTWKEITEIAEKLGIDVEKCL